MASSEIPTAPPQEQSTMAEIVERAKGHGDKYVQKIAAALKGNYEKHPDGWVREAMNLQGMRNYKSPLEQALDLEKVVVYHLCGNLWEAVLSGNAKLFTDQTALFKNRVRTINDIGWHNAIDEITIQEARPLIGKPIKTNRLQRYVGVLQEIVLPLIRDQIKPLTILDAGASAGVGVYAAKQLNLPLKSWIALDRDLPAEDLPWILSCSMRIDEITNDGLEKISLLIHAGEEEKFLIGDMENLPRGIADNSTDLYLANYSWYQLSRPNEALRQAFRVVRPGGLIIVSDSIIGVDQSERIQLGTPGGNVQPSTWVWIKGLNDNVIGPIVAYKWSNSEFNKGSPAELSKVQGIYQSFDEAKSYARTQISP